jgi:cyclic 2,3-diphosphoglycerate synthetase
VIPEHRPRVVALIDGEHYPPVVRFALGRLAAEADVVGLAFAGGTEKVDASDDLTDYGCEVTRGPSADAALAAALDALTPDEVVDLSDEPVVSSSDRMRLASLALGRGVAYRGADFRFDPPAAGYAPATPTLAIIGTGKRVGKTAISAHIARRLKARGTDLVVLAMGRGGPDHAELIRGDEVELTTKDLLALAAEGVHASSDCYEDAVMSRVTTVGSRRCGGGMAGATFYSNVEAGAELADSLGKQLLIAEGSGAAIPPVTADATLLVVGAAQGAGYVTEYFGPYRLARADAVIVAGAEPPFASTEGIAATMAAVGGLAPEIPVAAVTFRPHPIESVSGKRVFFATTASERILSELVAHLEAEHDCVVVGASAHLSDRTLLRADMRAAPDYDVLLTELKAAAVDVVAAAGAEAGVPTVLCDNVPVQVSGDDLDALIDSLGATALARGASRSRRQ